MAAEFVPFLRRLQPGAPAGIADAAAPDFVPAAPPRSAGSAAEPPAATAPEVTLHREGDRVTRIQVRCPCGRQIELECVY